MTTITHAADFVGRWVEGMLVAIALLTTAALLTYMVIDDHADANDTDDGLNNTDTIADM